MPVNSAIAGSGEANVRTAATEDTPNLECRDDGRTEGKGSGFDFRRMLARAVGKGIGA